MTNHRIPKVHKPSAEDRVSLKTKVAWGFGGLADNYIMNAFNALVLVLFVEGFKMPPLLAGVATFIPRFLDALIDPVVGNISDNTRTRWGRRRPYIAWGAVLSALLLPLLWYPPGSETAAAVWYANQPFLFMAILGTLYMTAYTIFIIPYTALGYELTNDYDERTRVLAWRMYIGLFGSMTVPWLYRWTQIDWMARLNEGPLRSILTAGLPGLSSDAQLVGARVVCIFVGVLIIASGILPSIFCRERLDVQHQKTVSLGQAVLYTFTNLPFAILSITYIIILIGLFSAGNIFMFLLIHYVFHGDRVAAGELAGLCGTIGAVVSYLSMFLIQAVSTRFSKKTGMISGLVLALIGVGAAWFVIDPRWPKMLIVSTIISSMGLQGSWLMISSMVADVCDEDELKTGLRREGMFSAVNGFSQKLAIAATSLISGGLLALAGFDPEAATSGGISMEVAYRLKVLVIGSQAIGLFVAIILMLFYPTTRKHAEETRRILDERKLREKAN